MEWTKLDRYDYRISPGIIQIKLSGTNDPDLVDIMAEINRSNGRIYCDGRRFQYLDYYEITGRGRNATIDLHASEM